MTRANAGLLDTRMNKETGSWLSIYLADAAHLDPAGGKYVTVCEKHGTLCNHRTLKIARHHLLTADWCEACQSILRSN
jgi:hypothetical protein